MTATANKIEKALSILKGHDWYWMMANYSNPAYGNAYASMRAFVEVVASIADNEIIKALLELWIAHYDYVHATMWGNDNEAKAQFQIKEAELMSIIMPTYAVAA